MIIKKGHSSSPIMIESNSNIQSQLKEAGIDKQFQNLLKEARKISAVSDEFNFSSCIMMHASEAALIDQDTGELKKNARGESVKGWFEPFVDHKGRESTKWVSPDNITPYANFNSDSFPESQLILAHKKWIGKPLCKDHISSSVDGIRGIIVDTYYDPKFKRVHALFALDRKNYPELARKVEAGYATNVSMGTAVGRSVCGSCGNVATVEAEYCAHVKNKTAGCEINLDLNPIELSLVVTGADPNAKVRMVLASMDNYFTKRADAITNGGTMTLGDHEHNHTHDPVEPAHIEEAFRSLEDLDKADAHANNYMEKLNSLTNGFKDLDRTQLGRVMSICKYLNLKDFYKTASDLRAEKDGINTNKSNDLNSDEFMPSRPIKHELPSNKNIFSKLNQSEVVKASIAQAKVQEAEVSNIVNVNKELPMNFAELKKRAELRLKMAYPQGTEENKKYPPMGDSDKIRNTQDKQMVGDMLDTKGDIPKDDLKKKEMIQRAQLEANRTRRAALLAQIKSAEVVTKKDESGKEVFVKKNPDGTLDELHAKDKAEDKVAKKAYYQGTVEPGKKYPPMGDSDKIRAKDDKHMNQTGSMGGSDGLVPGDEAKKKQLQRTASLKARLFKGAGSDSLFWEFYAGKDKVMTVTAEAAYEDDLDLPLAGTATMNGGEDMTAGEFFQTNTYAEKVMQLIRKAGLEKAAKELGAETALAPVGEPPAMDDESQSQDKVGGAISAIENACEDIRKAVGAEELSEVDVPSDAPAEGPPALPAPTAATVQLLTAFATMSDAVDEIKALDSAVEAGSEEAIPLLTEALADASAVVKHSSSLLSAFAAKKKDDKDAKKKKKEDDKKKDDKKKEDEKKKFLFAKDKDMKALQKKKDEEKAKKAKDAEKADKAKKDEKKKKTAAEFLSEALQARADRRQALVARAEMGDDVVDGVDATMEDASVMDTETDSGDQKMLTQEEVQELIDSLNESPSMSADDGQSPVMEVDENACGDGFMMAKDHKSDEDDVSAKEQKAMDETAEEEVDEHEDKMHDKKASRRAWRDALIAQAKGGSIEGLDLSEVYSGARSGGGTTSKFDTNPSKDLAKVETLTETHAVMMDVARSGPRNVRSAAEKLNTLISKGAINPAHLNEMIAEGAVDSETVSYWKQYFGEADGGKEFAAGLVKDFKQSKASVTSVSETEQQSAKLQRAYSVALDAQDRNIIPIGRTALHAYVNQLVKLPDVAFDSIKNVIAQHKKPEGRVVTAAPRSGLTYDTQTVSVESDVRPSGAPSFEDLADIFRK